MPRITQLDERRRIRQRRKKLFLFAGTFFILALLAITAFLLVRYVGFFDRSNIVVEGNASVDREEVLTVAYADFGRKWWQPLLGISNQFAWGSSISEEALRFSPRIKSIRAERNFFERSLVLYVVERVPVGIWCFHQEDPFYCGWFSAGGVLYAPAFRGQGSLLTVIDDYAQPRVSLGGAVLNQKTVERIIKITDELAAANLSVQEVRLESLALQELVVKTFPPPSSGARDGPDILFSLRFPPDGLGQALVRIGDRENVATLDYIDLRVEGRVYYQ